MAIEDVYEAVKTVMALPMTSVAAGIGAPTTPTATAVGTGGTFAAGTYYWKITATNAVGESLPSTEATATIVANGSATIAWTAVTGATGYRIYRSSTTGAENVSPALVGTSSGSPFTDTGTAPTTGAVPSTNTTSGAAGPSVQLTQTHENYRSAELVVFTGAITDGTYTIVPQESPDGTTWSAIPASRLEGASPFTFTNAQANSVIEVGVTPRNNVNNYVRALITATSVTTGGSVGALWVLGFGDSNPVVRP